MASSMAALCEKGEGSMDSHIEIDAE
jgi:hypothetical protein